jgi:hypothetical protein
MLGAVVLHVITLGVVTLNIVTLNVVAPRSKQAIFTRLFFERDRIGSYYLTH